MKEAVPSIAVILIIFHVAACYSPNQTTLSGPDSSSLNGMWELTYISGPRIAFEGLYPDKKPVLTFTAGKYDEIGGNTSCNGFSSKMAIDGSKISIAEPFAKTMIFCEGGGETTFLEMLKKVNLYSVSGTTLNLMIDEVVVMRFTKKQ